MNPNVHRHLHDSPPLDFYFLRLVKQIQIVWQQDKVFVVPVIYSSIVLSESSHENKEYLQLNVHVYRLYIQLQKSVV